MTDQSQVTTATAWGGIARGGITAPDWRQARRNLMAWWQSGDVPWFRDISIQARFTLLIAVVGIAGLTMAVAFGIGEYRISRAIEDQGEYQHLWEQSSAIRVGALAMQTAANGLTAERQRRFIDDFDTNLLLASQAMTTIRAIPVAAGHGEESAALEQALAALASQFKEVAATTLALGMTDNEGLRGRLSASVKAVEGELKMWPNTDDLKTRLLRMRDAEKDFLLSGDRSYLGRVRKYALEFDLGIDGTVLDTGTNWGRYAELFSYDYDSGKFSLEPADES